MNEEQITHPVLKVASSIGTAVGSQFMPRTWSEAAAMLSAFLTALFIIEWLWKRIGKPLAIRRGWMKGTPRNFMDSSARAELDALDEMDKRR